MTCPESRGNALPRRAKGRYDQYADISYPFRNWCAAAAALRDYCQCTLCIYNAILMYACCSMGRMNTGLKGEAGPCIFIRHLRGGASYTLHSAPQPCRALTAQEPHVCMLAHLDGSQRD